MPNVFSSARRLVFIDALRAFAILMMLQGHFIQLSLADEFRDDSSTLYLTWVWFRGMTAPIFFTVTGLVFVYLLSGIKTESIYQHQRWRKGIRRGFMLIGIGYLLRTNLTSLLSLHFADWMFQTDVLHCIGIALIALCGLYALARQSHLVFATLLLVVGTLVFLTAPWVQAYDTSDWWLPLSHFVNRQNGAIFSPLPWLGFSSFGALIGLSLRYFSFRRVNWLLSPALLIMGLLMARFSSSWLMDLHFFSGWDIFKSVAYNNGCFYRLGYTFVAISLFIWLFAGVDRLPEWLHKTGSETLTIYAAHYVVLYGTWFGLGIKHFTSHALNPIAVMAGATLFVLAGILLAVKLDGIRASSSYYRFTNLPRRIVSRLRYTSK